MKLENPKNVNYAATVVRVRHINVLANCDNVVGVPLLGYQAIVGKDTQVGDLGVLFTAESQLSTAYAAANNLHRHAERNADQGKAGYLEDNRRIKALRFRGHRSDALFMPLESLAYTGADLSQLKEGDVFAGIDGHEICRKYLLPQQRGRASTVSRPPRKERVDDKMMPKHFDTPNFFRNPDAVGASDGVVITQKLHGTSVRIGHTLVERKPTWRDKIAAFFGATVTTREWTYVYGSRNVIKDPDNPFAPSEFYGTDLYSEIGAQLKGTLPKGYIVYGEIIGWVPGTDTAIQRGYTYRIPQGVARLYVYRITTINEDGRAVDLSWPAVREFCESAGLDTVPELATGTGAQEEWINTFLDKQLGTWCPGALMTDGDTVDEGVCIRAEATTPIIVKAKSPEFLRHETKMLDKGVVDIEAQETTV